MAVEMFIQDEEKCTSQKKEVQARWYIRTVIKGQVFERDGIVCLRDSTEQRASLLALMDALGRFNKAAEIKLYISNSHIRAAMNNGWLAKWQENNFITTKGDSVRYASEWQQVSELLKIHKVVMAPKEELGNRYSNELRRRINASGKD